MKKITIPVEFGQPVVTVRVNDQKYVLETGKEIVVEDHIADLVTASINSSEPDMEPVRKTFGPGKPVVFFGSSNKLYREVAPPVAVTAEEMAAAYFGDGAYVIDSSRSGFPVRVVGFSISSNGVQAITATGNSDGDPRLVQYYFDADISEFESELSKYFR